MSVELTEIEPHGSLDRVHAFWMNTNPGQGYVTVICYGSAWTAYFGGMGDATIQQFFERADVGYLASKMRSEYHKNTARVEKHILAIIDAVKRDLRSATLESQQ